jgi:hypothetical protein
MPYPNEHAARIQNPLSGDSAVYARKNIAPGIDIILQKPKGDASAPMRVQAYRFDKNVFTPEEAKSWLKKHSISFILFEPASQPSQKENKKELLNRISKELTGAMIR